MNNPASTNLPPETPGEDALKRLALDLRRAWDRPASELWGRLDPELWDLTQNPWIVLQTVSRERLRDVSGDPAFRRLIDEMLARARTHLDRVPPEALAGEAASGTLIIDTRPVEQRERDGALPGAVVVDPTNLLAGGKIGAFDVLGSGPCRQGIESVRGWTSWLCGPNVDLLIRVR